MTSKNSQKFSNKKFYCEKCQYYAKRKSDLNKHYKSKKHNTYNTSKNSPNTSDLPFVGECGKKYKHRQSLNNHRKNCDYGEVGRIFHEKILEGDIISEGDLSLTNMFMTLMEKNQELQDIICNQNEKILELAKEPKTIIQKQTNHNTFNMENFLNVQCRDAMNLSEFLEQMEISFDDLLYLGEHGFVNSVKHTFVKQLQNLDQNRRPIHCSDRKRKTLMVKNEDKWHKDNNHNLIHEAITKVNKKQIGAFTEHSKQRPENYLHDERNLDKQNRMIINMCSYNSESSETMNKKIIKDLSEAVPIEKTNA